MAYETYGEAGGGLMSKGIGMTVIDNQNPVKADHEYWEKRKQEESGPVTTGVHPVHCVKQGLPLERAAKMRPEDLTPVDAKLLVGKGVTLAAIAELYGMSGKAAFDYMAKHGIRKTDAPEYPWTGVAVVKEPKKPAQEAEVISGAIADDTAHDMVNMASDVEPAEEPVALTPTDLTREQAARLLLQGVTKPELQRNYNFKNAVALYYKLERFGLHKRLQQGEKHDPEEVKRMAAAVLQEIEAEKSAAPQLTPEQIDRFEDLKPRPATEPELREMFEEPSPAARAIEAAGLKVETGERPVPAELPDDFEECGPLLYQTGDLWIRIAHKRKTGGGSIAFSSAAWKVFTGNQFSLEVSRHGDRVRLTKKPDGKFKANGNNRHVAAGNALEKLRQRDVELPARYLLRQEGDVWIGSLEKGAAAG